MPNINQRCCEPWDEEARSHSTITRTPRHHKLTVAALVALLFYDGNRARAGGMRSCLSDDLNHMLLVSNDDGQTWRLAG